MILNPNCKSLKRGGCQPFNLKGTILNNAKWRTNQPPRWVNESQIVCVYPPTIHENINTNAAGHERGKKLPPSNESSHPRTWAGNAASNGWRITYWMIQAAIN